MLTDALPFLVLKREQALIVLELAATQQNHGRRGYPIEIRQYRYDLVQQLYALNRKGPR